MSELTNEQKAQAYRELTEWLLGHEEHSVISLINQRIDELDPPIPAMSGDPILWRWDNRGQWRHGIIEGGCWTRSAEGALIALDNIDWKPARLLGPRQVSVTIPRTDEWPNDAAHCEAGITWTGYRNIIRVQRVITRPEAERMEASDGHD
jgi:hypothetical protein